MKSNVIERPFPKTDEEWEALIAEAPGEDRPLDADVLAALKATGNGWQTRVNEVMRDWVRTHP